MTRILVQRGSGSSSNQGRASASASSSASRPEAQVSSISQIGSLLKDEEVSEELPEQVVVDEFVEYCGDNDKKGNKSDEPLLENSQGDNCESLSYEIGDNQQLSNDEGVASGNSTKRLDGIKNSERPSVDTDCKSDSCRESVSPLPPPPPVPPPKPSSTSFSPRRSLSGGSNSARMGSSRRSVGWPVVSTRTSPSGSRPSSPKAHGESEGYNSADEQNSGFVSSYDDVERERQFEIDIRRSKGLEVRKMMEDGNCLFRAVADQVYGDSEAYDLVRQMCIDYMERERDHFSQFITEGFTSYCKRKRRDKVYGNNVEIQAMSEMYNRPIHIYSYSTDPINIFHGSYNTDVPPIRLSYHHGNHYNSLVDPRRMAIGAGLGFSCLRGTNVDKDQVKEAIKAQQDQQIDNALLAEGRFYSDLELTEKEIELMVMEASRVEYIASDKWKQQVGNKETSTSGAEPSSSGASSETQVEGPRERNVQDSVLSSSMQIVLSMGFSYLQVIEAYSIFGDDVDSMVCYLLETGGSNNRRKGKATEQSTGK